MRYVFERYRVTPNMRIKMAEGASIEADSEEEARKKAVRLFLHEQFSHNPPGQTEFDLVEVRNA